MAKKRERLNVSVSFTDEERDVYEHTKKQPNVSLYIKELIKENMIKIKEKKDNTIQEIDADIDISDYLNLM